MFLRRVDKRLVRSLIYLCVLKSRIRSVPHKEGIAVFASLKVAIAGIRSLLRELTSTPYAGDQSVQRVPDMRKLAAADQRAHDLNSLLERGVVS